MTIKKPVILTGIRSNSELTLGNYIGAIKPLIELQAKHSNDYTINMFVPDLHSFTTPIDHGKLFDNTIANLKIFVACGLDINNGSSFIYRQSRIPAHCELTWILDCFIHIGELNRMTQFKDKSSNNEAVSVGLFNYPVLMAADILLYDALYVPVGEDQRQHLELTRDIAIRFNHQFNKQIFTIPKKWDEQLKFVNLTQGLRIRSLKNPNKKMSKSVSDPAGTILLSDDPAKAAAKIKSATTDSLGIIDYDLKSRPGISNLLQILAFSSNQDLNETIKQWAGKTMYGELKKITAESVFNFLTNFQNKLSQIDETTVLKKIAKDEITMNEIANKKLLEAQKAVGLVR